MTAADPDPPIAPTPISGHAITVLAVLAVIVALWWGRSFMVPLTAGLMLALLVMPVTTALRRWLRVRAVAVPLTLVLQDSRGAESRVMTRLLVSTSAPLAAAPAGSAAAVPHKR